MALDGDKIRGINGNMYAHIFENPNVGVARGLYWAVTVDCEPIEWNGEDWPCSVTCEWLQWPIRRWEEIDGVGLETTIAPVDAECSFYLAEHNPVRIKSLSISREPNKNQFLVCISGAVELLGFDELDGEDIPFFVQGRVDFDGIILIPDNLSPKPSTPTDAIDILSEFLSMESLKEPRWDRFRYVFEPT